MSVFLSLIERETRQQHWTDDELGKGGRGKCCCVRGGDPLRSSRVIKL